MKKQIAIYGAIDRFNYGDLLFAIILYEMFKEVKGYSIDYYALCNSDLQSLGGKPTRSIQDLFTKDNLKDGSIAIVAGGEVLGATWFKLHRYILPHHLSFPLRVASKLLNSNILDYISRKTFHSRLKLPFVISPDDFHTDVNVVYNAVGGSSLYFNSSRIRKHVLTKLHKASHLSVRDKDSIKLLSKDSSVKVYLKPDSACLMSELFPLNKLKTMISQETHDIIDQFKPGYLCFQVSDDHARDHINTIVEQLNIISQKTGLAILLLPIGRAAGHEDQKPLNKIKQRLKVPCILPSENSVFDIMTLIAKAKVFAGTSLHGCITAMSFAVPYIGLTFQVPKLQAYLQTWAMTELSFCRPYSMLGNSVEAALTIPKDKLKSLSDNYIKESKEDFFQIKKTLGMEI